MESINPSFYPATRAGAATENFINYKLGGPHRLFQLKVTEARKESIPGVGNKYYITSSMKDLVNERPAVSCTAEILYYQSDQQKAPDVSFNLQTELENYTLEKDIEFYDRMKALPQPLKATDIPDKFGNVAADMEPVWHLALAACGYVKWQNSTEDTFYAMALIKSVKQKKRQDTALEFHYVMLIHEMVTQEMIPWQIDILWDPWQGIKIENQVRLPKSCCS
ncbi:latexin [Spea bombifrons]|uniref:latexin n=1 Tax=Spea bombifrons TaxID=233779 RepID=UPI00234A397D|nr:latexin [Spea bombifrons]